MSNQLITTIKSWNIKNAKRLKNKDIKNNWHIMSEKDDLTYENVKRINPRYIFIPHWSWIVPKDIWKNYETIVFHCADLPFGRGGSPVQNLIAQGIYKTKISSLRVKEGLDTGPIYMKNDLDISKGTIEDILTEASDIIFKDMIPYIIKNNPQPTPQEGKPVVFRRRKLEDGNLSLLVNPTPRQLYDYVRMLDGEGYPRAYIPLKEGKLEFYDASFKNNLFDAKCNFVKNVTET